MRLHYLSNLMQKATSRWSFMACLVGLLLILPTQFTLAQNVPIISGGLGFLDSTNTGANFFQPVVDPVVVAPLGSHLLAESRFDFREFFSQQNGTSGPYQGTFSGSVQYLQLDYIALPKLTFVFGQYLTPFGTYNERLTPIWIQNLQDAPLIFALGTRTTGSSDGAMVRGVVYSDPKVQVN